MVKSMTGYGRARETRNKRDITVEVRSVNNRYLDCTVKLPRAYVFAEDAIKGRVQKAVSRGKVDVFVTIDSSAADVSVVKVNEPLARSYYEALLRDMLRGDEPVGRKLDFLIQEINRECNTIGSKCSDLTITQDVVNMKAEVEKIREQVQNIE